MNRSNKIQIKNEDKTDIELHNKIHNMFISGPSGGTPTMKCMKNILETRTKPTMIYLLTDGTPSDTSVDELAKYLNNRRDAKNCPITLLSCTDNDNEAEWMKELEEHGPFISEVDDYEDERREIIHDQGQIFPFSFGFYVICLLVSCIYPDDLDALDDSKPITKFTLTDLMGRQLTDEEYRLYWTNHPRRSDFENKYTEFLNGKLTSNKIVTNDKNIPMKKLTGFFKKLF